MRINLFPQRRDDALLVVRSSSSLIVNGETFDFSPMADGSTLPAAALSSSWFFGQVDNVGGELVLSLILPLPVNYSQAQAFPAPLHNVLDGPVALPQPLPSDEPSAEQEPILPRAGSIDWSQLVTAEMKAAEVLAERLAESKSRLAARSEQAATQIDRITDRIETLGYGIEAGEATPEDAAEQAALAVNLKT